MLPFYSAFEEINNEVRAELMEFAAPSWQKHTQTLSKTVVLCLHGYTATPREVQPAVKTIFRKGIDAISVLFPAHGWKNSDKAKRSLGQLKYEELLQCVRSEIKRAREIYQNVFIYGQSMGGAVAVVIAEEGLVDACALTAPAIKLPLKGEIAAILVGWLNLNLRKANGTVFYHECYNFNNSRSVKELNKLAKIARSNLQKIQCPVLECHSILDRDITPRVTQWIESWVSGNVSIEWYNKSGHTMLLDVQGEEISESIARFFAQEEQKLNPN
jgi:carboxylesterase